MIHSVTPAVESSGHNSVALAVPCFNERCRLDVAQFAGDAFENGLRILFVDDGSTDGTAGFIADQIVGFSHVSLLRHPSNQGKGAAVRMGMLHLAEHYPGAAWIGFWDADLSTPLAEVRHMLRFLEMEGGAYDAVWASRVMRGGSRITRSFKRHLFGRLFATAAGEFLNVRIYDTQCGAKLFRRDVVEDAFRGEFISRWIFDVELCLRIGQERILECPVLAWSDAPHSKVRLLRDLPRVACDLLRIRLKYGRAGV